jgi:type I restriction enzyme M protein
MAQKKNSKSIEESLWQSCDKLRGSVEPPEYNMLFWA